MTKKKTDRRKFLAFAGAGFGVALMAGGKSHAKLGGMSIGERIATAILRRNKRWLDGPISVGNITYQDFMPLIGEDFTVNGWLKVRLTDVRSLGITQPGCTRQAFSV